MNSIKKKHNQCLSMNACAGIDCICKDNVEEDQNNRWLNCVK